MEIAVLPVFEPGEEIDKGGIFFPACLDIPGVHAENAPDQRHIGNQTQMGHPRHQIAKKTAQQNQHHTADQQPFIQCVGAVTAHHKITEPVSQFAEHRITCTRSL